MLRRSSEPGTRQRERNRWDPWVDDYENVRGLLKHKEGLNCKHAPEFLDASDASTMRVLEVVVDSELASNDPIIQTLFSPHHDLAHVGLSTIIKFGCNQASLFPQ